MKRWLGVLVTLVATAALVSAASAEPVSPTIPMTFRTTLAAGNRYFFTFRLFDAAAGGTELWTETTPTRLAVSSSRTIQWTLGSVVPFSDGLAGPVDFSQQLWVQFTGGGKTPTRVRLSSVPYALWSANGPEGPPGPPGPPGAGLPTGVYVLSENEAPLSGFTATSQKIASYGTDVWQPLVGEGNMAGSSVIGGGVVDQKIYSVTAPDYSPYVVHTWQYDPSAGSWIETANSLIYRRPNSGARTLPYNGKVYFFGGSGGSGRITAVEEYDPYDGSSDVIGSMPVYREYFALEQENGIFYIIGGRENSSSGSAIPVPESFDSRTRQWSSLAPMPYPLMGSVAVIHQGLIYVLGGHEPGEGYKSVCQIYDIAENSWSTDCPSMPFAITNACATLHGGKIYIIGGETPEQIRNVVQEYSISERTWRVAPRTEAPNRGNCVAGTLGESIYVFGTGASAGPFFEKYVPPQIFFLHRKN